MPASIASSPERLLVRGANWLGDAVMTTPALQRLRERFPGTQITLLTHEKLVDLWLNHPSIDRVITFTEREGPWSIARRVRAHNFDAALVLPNSPRSALECWFARIPQRVGYARPWRNCFLTERVPTRVGQARMQKRSVAEINRLVANHGSSSPHDAMRFTVHDHHINDYLSLAAAVGADSNPVAPNLFVSGEEIEAATRKFKLPKTNDPRPIFGLNPGAEYGPAKRWPADRFAAAAIQIQKQTNCVWLIFGGRTDVSIAAEIHSALLAPGAFNLAGQTTLRELMALLKLCRVLLTNDSGPMHVAAALGTPVVVPFGSTSPELTGPGFPGETQHRLLSAGVPCSPCFLRTCPIDLRCMTGISAERVVEAVQQAAQVGKKVRE